MNSPPIGRTRGWRPRGREAWRASPTPKNALTLRSCGITAQIRAGRVRGIARSCGSEDGSGLDFNESADRHEGMDADESACREMVAEQLTAQRGEEATLTRVRDVHGHAHDVG